MIVEGHGEVEAAPLLIRRLLHEQFQRYDLEIKKPFNAHSNSNILKPGGLENFLELARRAVDPCCQGLIVLLDAEREHHDCPPNLAVSLARRTARLGLPFPVAIVCANCEYESWFIASLHTMRSHLRPNVKYPGDPEQECGAKGWLSENMPPPRVYKETVDQVKLTQSLDIPHTIKHSRSFQRMVHAVEQLTQEISSGKVTISPLSDDETG